MRARKVRPADLATVRNEAWVEPARRPYVQDGIAYVPVRDGYPADCELAGPARYRGRGYFMLGDVAVIHGRAPSDRELEAIIGLKRPRGIVHIRSVSDTTRVPDCEVLYGEAGEVVHREGGYRYFLDPCRVMFSQGNLSEKRRMAALVREGSRHERVADMFAGIGYFTIPVAGAGASVHAMEINPVSFRYLLRNIAANGLSDQVSPMFGDCRDLLSGTYDRIIMGHFDSITMLAPALSHVTPGTVIHLHSIGDATDTIHAELAGAGFSADVHVHKVKKYRPHEWHVVQDIVIR